MRLDSHQHFWRYNSTEYGWMTEATFALKRDYLPEDLKPLLNQAGIQGTIAVQARQILDETDWLLQLADRYDFIRGVVGWVDLCAPDVEEQLKRYAIYSKFRGVRHVVHDEPNDDYMLMAEFLRGLGTLADFNLTYDLLILPRHLSVAVEVVQQFPRQRFVLDHLAKPFIKSQVVMPWEADIRALARCENVYCKVSGMVTEAAWRHWKISDFRRYLDIVFDCFGIDRLMFGSDWPVCTLSADYPDVVNIVQDYARQFSEAVQEKIFGGNAAAFYGIEDS